MTRRALRHELSGVIDAAWITGHLEVPLVVPLLPIARARSVSRNIAGISEIFAGNPLSCRENIGFLRVGAIYSVIERPTQVAAFSGS